MEFGDVRQKIALSTDRIIGRHSMKKKIPSTDKLYSKSVSHGNYEKKTKRKCNICYDEIKPVPRTRRFQKSNTQSVIVTSEDVCNVFFTTRRSNMTVITDRKRGPCNCIIETLLKRRFRGLPFAKKLEIIKKGPPKPSLSSLIVHNNRLNLQKSFNQNRLIYEKTLWMCGCVKHKKIYCWPCLLFSNLDNVWNTSVNSDYDSLNKAEKNHEKTCSHIISLKELKSFGVANKKFDKSLSSDYKILVSDYNNIVKHNRKIFKYVMTAVCYLGSGGINLYDSKILEDTRNENSDITDGNYFNFMNIIAEYNNDLRTHINTDNMFSIFSYSICNDLVFCVSEIMLQEIKKEIDEASFVSLILNEMTDNGLTNYVSFVVRYVGKKGFIKERFLNFIELKSNYYGSYNFIKMCIIKLINEFNCGSKLVAYNIDGRLLELDKLSCLQEELCRHFNQALFVDSYFNELIAVLSQSLCFIKDVKLFFASLSLFRDFFLNFSQRIDMFDDFLKISENQWTCECSLITILHGSRRKFEEFFLSIIFHPNSWDLNTISMAYNLFMMLNDFHFNFYLALFSLILPHAKSLFCKIQKHILIDIRYCYSKIDNFNLYLFNLLENFDGFWSTLHGCDFSEHKSKDYRIDNDNEQIPKYDKIEFSQYFTTIISTVVTNIAMRYESLLKINFFSLLNVKKFQQFKTEFPVVYLNCLEDIYGSHFDLNRLKNELNVLYWDRMNIKYDLFSFYNYFRRCNLDSVFPETCKLCELILTMPFVNPGNENISALTRMKMYIQKTETHTDLFPMLAILYIERLFLKQIKTEKDFENNVIDLFATKNHKIKLTYKT